MTTSATRIQSSWSDWRHYPSVAEVVCAAALAATGHLTSVEYMVLRNLELPRTEDMLSLARLVTSGVVLDRVTGDIGPLLSSLSCAELQISNMELQAATSSLVWGLQHGVAELRLGGRVRLHIQTLLEWDGRGRCGEVTCWHDTRDTYKEEMRTWAARVNWNVEGEDWIVMRRK